MGSRKKKAGRTRTYDVHGLDVWGNEEEGFQVNDVYPSRGTVEISDDANDQEVVRALKSEGFIDRNIRFKSAEVDWTERGYEIYINEARSGRPVYELRPRERG